MLNQAPSRVQKQLLSVSMRVPLVQRQPERGGGFAGNTPDMWLRQSQVKEVHKLVTHKRHLNDTQLHAHYLLNCLPKKCTLELISLVAGVPTCHLSSSSNKHLQLEVGQSCLQLINIQPFLHSSTLQTSASSFFPNTYCFISLCGINFWKTWMSIPASVTAGLIVNQWR